MNMKSTMEYEVAEKSTERILMDGVYQSNWGATDLYDKAEKNLRELLTEKGEFHTEWCDSKKELESFRLWFTDDEITIEVSKWMDELYEQSDLICDALWSLGKDDVELEYEDIGNIQDMCWDADIKDETQFSEEVSRDITYEKLMEKIDEMLFEADEFLNGEFERVKSIVSYYLEHEKESDGEKDDE